MHKMGIVKVLAGLMIVFAISCSVNPSADYVAQNSALVVAASANDFKQVQNLLKKGADVNAKTTFGHTALMEASEMGHTEIVELLKAHGAKE